MNNKNLRGASYRRFCDSHRIQTYNLLIRSQMLYSVELANRFLFVFEYKSMNIFLIGKAIALFFEKKSNKNPLKHGLEGEMINRVANFSKAYENHHQ